MSFVLDFALKLRQLLSAYTGQEAPDKPRPQSRALSPRLDDRTPSLAKETKTAHSQDRQTHLQVQKAIRLENQQQKHPILNLVPTNLAEHKTPVQVYVRLLTKDRGAGQ